MIDGLKLTLTGEEIRGLIEQRAAEHRAHAADWTREAARTEEEQTEENPVLPEHICQYEAERHEWRGEVLTFLRDHLDPSEVYRLTECDLEFAELLPPRPESLEQNEYEERTWVGVGLEGIARRLSDRSEIVEFVHPDFRADRPE